MRSWLPGQPLPQLRPPPPHLAPSDGNSNCLLLGNEDNEPLAPGHSRVQKVPGQHGVVLRGDRDDYRRIFRALALVDRGRKSWEKGVENRQPKRSTLVMMRVRRGWMTISGA
jgi:hypothetical protein